MNKEQQRILVERLLDYEARPLSTISYFLNNKNELDKSKNWKNDKFYHARANAQAGQIFDAPTALFIDIGREAWDNLRKNTWDRKAEQTPKEILEDSKNDMKANFYGLGQGLLHPLQNVDNILDKNYLRGLND